ncbi:hypothetical protein P389DRAFT_175483 [Cystobasidium minutum MCA 4210]|uniref:uncharacterized protein n=1 Tax=Cystobasidium minutum MCA 4210 TaxID=1397322 RepID=UPI0034CD7BF2|eukprot:jgi/Rhomi1/175483/fgenesh1_kg.10_\
MDSSITKILQAVQEEFPPSRKPRRQSSNASSSRSSSSIPIMDDNSLPTSSELYSYTTTTGQSPPDIHTTSALSTSPPSAQEASNIIDIAGIDGQSTPRAERRLPSMGSVQDSNGNGGSQPSEYLPQRQEVSTTSALPVRINTQVQNTSGSNPKSPTSSTSTSSRSPRLSSAPTFISLPPMPNAPSNSNSMSSGFKPSSSMLHKNEGLMLTPGGDDIPFQFKKRPTMQDRRPSHEIFA